MGLLTRHTSEGHVPAHCADCAHAIDRARICCQSICLILFETFGNFGPGVVRLLHKLSGHVCNKLTHAQ
jgi:hypothetical protein